MLFARIPIYDEVGQPSTSVENECGFFTCAAALYGNTATSAVRRSCKKAAGPATNPDKRVAVSDAANEQSNAKNILNKK